MASKANVPKPPTPVEGTDASSFQQLGCVATQTLAGHEVKVCKHSDGKMDALCHGRKVEGSAAPPCDTPRAAAHRVEGTWGSRTLRISPMTRKRWRYSAAGDFFAAWVMHTIACAC